MNVLETSPNDCTLGDPLEKPRRVTILGLPVACVQIPDVIDLLSRSIDLRHAPRYFVLLGMHGLMEARSNPKALSAFQQADFLLPDGMPLVWLSRLRGQKTMVRRVYGPELMMTFCERTQERYKHYFYGAGPGVAEKLATTLRNRFGIQIAGIGAPPYRELTDAELVALSHEINQSNADVVWIGISTPKQDILMMRLKPLINAPVMLGVGAAFDFNSGQKTMAPRWMQENGLEWLYRLLSEPRRLGRRYLTLGPKFVALALMELAGFKTDPQKASYPTNN
ncbi:MAG: WecB/TagA/CpsF family glycosyltransferase [Planctomycetes bacterium]|nr:WecB/TagA/CpsF family glycosyltransferase [Planctomycetota bacterium]